MTVQRTVHRRGLRAFKQQKTSRLIAVRQDQYQETGATWCLVKNIRSNNGGIPRHTLSGPNLSEVPGHEMERWGLAVNTWAGFSSRGKTKLAFYPSTLD